MSWITGFVHQISEKVDRERFPRVLLKWKIRLKTHDNKIKSDLCILKWTWWFFRLKINIQLDQKLEKRSIIKSIFAAKKCIISFRMASGWMKHWTEASTPKCMHKVISSLKEEPIHFISNLSIQRYYLFIWTVKWKRKYSRYAFAFVFDCSIRRSISNGLNVAHKLHE